MGALGHFARLILRLGSGLTSTWNSLIPESQDFYALTLLKFSFAPHFANVDWDSIHFFHLVPLCGVFHSGVILGPTGSKINVCPICMTLRVKVSFF